MDHDVMVIEQMDFEIEELKQALHDSINSPKGVVPQSAQKFYEPKKYYNKEA